MHSTLHKSTKDLAGKKVIIVGSANSAHDIAADCVQNGVGQHAFFPQRPSIYSPLIRCRMYNDLFVETLLTSTSDDVATVSHLHHECQRRPLTITSGSAFLNGHPDSLFTYEN